MRALARLAALAMVLICGHAFAADEDAPNRKPVKPIADARLSIGGRGMLPLYLSRDWSMPQPTILRAIIVLHGRLRNADEYYISANNAQAAHMSAMAYTFLWQQLSGSNRQTAGE